MYPSQKSVSEILNAPAAKWNAPAENGQGVKRMGGKDRASWAPSDPQLTPRFFLWAGGQTLARVDDHALGGVRIGLAGREGNRPQLLAGQGFLVQQGSRGVLQDLGLGA